MDLLRVEGYAVLGMGAIRAPPFGWLAHPAEPILLLLTDVVMPLMSGRRQALIAIELEAGASELAPGLAR